MMNKDRLIGAIGSSLIGVSVTGILYCLTVLKTEKDIPAEELTSDTEDVNQESDSEMEEPAEK